MGLLFFCTFGQLIMTVLIFKNARHNVPLVIWTVGFLTYDLYQVSKVFGG